MLNFLGVPSIDALFEDVPSHLRMTRELQIPGPSSELEVYRELLSLANQNRSLDTKTTFLHGVHWIPAAIDVVKRGEFLSSYTPYAPEISQGMLQALFEYQSLICELTGMEVANSSMYDFATSLGEAARMAARATRRNRVLVAKAIAPHRVSVLETYCRGPEITVETIPFDSETGELSMPHLQELLSEDVACVYLESPNLFGVVETAVAEMVEAIHSHGSLAIVGIDPFSLAILEPPGNYGADIVIGEGQALGNPISFGGPLLGVFASRKKLLRMMPGRLIGKTVTQETRKEAYCMTLQTREQHIRREKANSNICSNEAHCALTAAAYLLLLGPQGLREIAETMMGNTALLVELLNSSVEGIAAPRFSGPHFGDFVVSLPSNEAVPQVRTFLFERNIEVGPSLERVAPSLAGSFLCSISELTTREDMNRLASSLQEYLGRTRSQQN